MMSQNYSVLAGRQALSAALLKTYQTSYAEDGLSIYGLTIFVRQSRESYGVYIGL